LLVVIVHNAGSRQVTTVLSPHLKFGTQDTLAWYRASASAGRGFCKQCGSLLFWKGDGKTYTSISAGSINGVTDLKIEGHIYCADKGDYYDILDGNYQRAQWT
jgi:hypothetical protein